MSASSLVVTVVNKPDILIDGPRTRLAQSD